MRRIFSLELILPIFLLSFISITKTTKAQELIYLNVNQQVTEEKFAYYYQTTVKDSGDADVLKITYTNGAVFFEGAVLYNSNPENNEKKYVGLCKWYYKNGNLKQVVANYDQYGRIDGKVSTYHENGKLKSTIDYKSGVRLNKLMTVYDEEGKESKWFMEDFTSNSNEWEVYKSELNEAYIENKQFVLLSNTESGTSRHIKLPIKSSTFEIELEIAEPEKKNPSQIKGLIFNFKDWSNYAYFFIDDMYYSIGAYEDGVHYKSADLLSSIKIDVEAKNTLKIKNDIDKCLFFINGHRVHAIKPIEIKHDKIGMVVGGKGMCKFNSLSVKESSVSAAYQLDDKNLKGTGSGFLISENGHIVTNHHVIEDANKIFVEFPSLNKTYEATTVIKDENSDLALLKIKDPNYTKSPEIPFTLSSSTSDVGSSVFTLGYPFVLSGLGKEVKFADGKISSKTGYNNEIYTYQTTIPVQPGNSGSPMFDDDGNVVGCMNAVYRNADNVSYSIKSNYIRTIVESSPEKVALPTQNTIKELPITEKIKVLSNYVCIIKIL